MAPSSDNPLDRMKEAIARLSALLRDRRDVGELAAMVAKDACDLVGAESCSVMLLDTDKTQLSTYASHGLSAEEVREIKFAVGEGIAGKCVAEKRAFRIDDVTTDPRFSARAQPLAIKSLLVVPIVVRGAAIGALSVTHSREAAFGDTEGSLLDLWAQAIGMDLESALLYRLSMTDALTRVYNRRYLEEVVPRQLAFAAREETPIAALFVDLDDFKRINDRHGHEAGDRVLVETSARLRAAVRLEDVVMRYGGDEFLVLLIGPSALQADAVASRVAEAIAREPVGGLEVRASVGVASSGAATTFEDLLRNVDKALYAAKAHKTPH